MIRAAVKIFEINARVKNALSSVNLVLKADEGTFGIEENTTTQLGSSTCFVQFGYDHRLIQGVFRAEIEISREASVREIRFAKAVSALKD